MFRIQLKKVPHMIILLFVYAIIAGCSFKQNKLSSLSDCEKIRDVIQKEECIADYALILTSDNVDNATMICNTIKNSIVKDSCFLEIHERLIGQISMNQLLDICNKVENTQLKETCLRITYRPHMQQYIKES